jgi:4-diphosphocytidyl-2-C-methyl-D-erythritol kinase
MKIETIPDGLRVLAHAKVNLYLEVLGLRPDGFHEIDTIFQEVSLHDEIEFRPRGDREIRLSIEGPDGRPSDLSAGEDNLIIRAVRLYLEAFGPGRLEGGFDIRLRKRIPMGAGLGGGSSDAAATLAAMDRITGDTAGFDRLLPLGARLGSDVTFFLLGGTVRGRGRGEQLHPLGPVFGPGEFHCVLAYPGFQVPTSLIYRELDRPDASPLALTTPPSVDNMTDDSIRKALRGYELLFNRLEHVAFRVFPKLESFKKEIEREPFAAVLMSGSGSTIYGVTGSRREAEEIASRLRDRLQGIYFAVEGESGRATDHAP